MDTALNECVSSHKASTKSFLRESDSHNLRQQILSLPCIPFHQERFCAKGKIQTYEVPGTTALQAASFDRLVTLAGSVIRCRPELSWSSATRFHWISYNGSWYSRRELNPHVFWTLRSWRSVATVTPRERVRGNFDFVSIYYAQFIHKDLCTN